MFLILKKKFSNFNIFYGSHLLVASVTMQHNARHLVQIFQRPINRQNAYFSRQIRNNIAVVIQGLLVLINQLQSQLDAEEDVNNDIKKR